MEFSERRKKHKKEKFKLLRKGIVNRGFSYATGDRKENDLIHIQTRIEVSLSNRREKEGTVRYVNNDNLIQIKCNSFNPGSSGKFANFCFVNANSVRNKDARTVRYILDNDIDLCAIAETRLRDSDNTVRSTLKPDGY